MSAAQTTARARAQTKQQQSKGGCAVARSFSAADLLDSARSCWAGRSGGACACRCSAALDAASSFSIGSAAEYCSLRGISRRATPSTVNDHKIHDGAARIAAVFHNGRSPNNGRGGAQPIAAPRLRALKSCWRMNCVEQSRERARWLVACQYGAGARIRCGHSQRCRGLRLVHARLSAGLSAADRVLPKEARTLV